MQNLFNRINIKISILFILIFISCNYQEINEIEHKIERAQFWINDARLQVEKLRNKIEINSLKADRIQDQIKALSQEQYETEQFHFLRTSEEREQQLQIISIKRENLYREYDPIYKEGEYLKGELSRVERNIEEEKERLELYQKRLLEL